MPDHIYGHELKNKRREALAAKKNASTSALPSSTPWSAPFEAPSEHGPSVFEHETALIPGDIGEYYGGLSSSF
jgi:hypothetical protein